MLKSLPFLLRKIINYPMFITDAKAIGEIADIDIQNLETKEVKIEQFFEE